MNAIERDLVARFGEAALRFDEAARDYLHDSTEMQGLFGRADAVVVPKDTAEVAELLAWCYERGVALVPRGGGTGFAGGAVPTEGGVVCSLERLDRVRHFEPEYWRAEVEAGVTTGRVHRLARENGLFYPPDPGATEQSHIGGNIACNAGGPHSFKYGVTGHWVTGLEAVLAPGEVHTFGGSYRKDVAGYDVRSLLIGSEGTLGIVTAAWLRLIPAPSRITALAATYPDLDRGIAALQRVLGHGLVPATLEYFVAAAVALIRAGFPASISPDSAFLILSEVDGDGGSVPAQVAGMREALGDGALDLVQLETRSEIESLTRWRGGVSFAVRARRGGKMSEDIAVPFDALGDAVRMVKDVGAAFGLESCSWGHAGDAYVHATFLIDAGSPAEVAQATAATREVFTRALGLGGTVSGEHGLGWVKRDQFDLQFSAQNARLQRMIKAVFDPQNLLNPGKKSSYGLAGAPREGQGRA